MENLLKDQNYLDISENEEELQNRKLGNKKILLKFF